MKKRKTHGWKEINCNTEREHPHSPIKQRKCSQSSFPTGRAVPREHPANVHPESHRSPTSSANPVLLLTMTSHGMDFSQSGSAVPIQQLSNTGGITTAWLTSHIYDSTNCPGEEMFMRIREGARSGLAPLVPLWAPSLP